MPTRAHTMPAAPCGDRVLDRPQASGTHLLVVQERSVSRASPLRRYRSRSYQLPEVREASAVLAVRDDLPLAAPDHEIDRRLRAGRDDDLVGLTMHRSRGSQILAELLPQLRQTPRI